VTYIVTLSLVEAAAAFWSSVNASHVSSVPDDHSGATKLAMIAAAASVESSGKMISFLKSQMIP